MYISYNITDFFEEKLRDLKCQHDTKSYIIGIYGKYKTSAFDLSKESVALLLAQGRNKQDFLTFQNIGDYIFWANTMAPDHLQKSSKDYYDTIARLSYYSCYRLINRQWKLYEELADQFLLLEQQAKNLLHTISITSNTFSDSYILPFY